MNPDLTVNKASSSPQIQNPQGRTSLVGRTDSVSKIENVILVSSGHKRNGKIARLPKTIRDKINQWIDDGRTYPQIIKDLGDDAKDLKPGHFSEWRKGGYEDYLRHQERRDQLRILRENSSEMSELTDGHKFQETLIQIALTEIFRVIQQGELKPDSLNYIRLFNALARLNREALGLRKYNDLLAKEQAQLKQLDPNREFSQNEHRAVVDRADRIFRMPRPGGPLWSAPAERSGDGALVGDTLASSNCPATTESLATDHSPLPTESFSIQNPKSKIKNASSPLPSRPCRANTPDPCSRRREEAEAQTREQQAAHDPPATESHATDYSLLNTDSSPIQNPISKIENCLDCSSPLPPIPPNALPRTDDYCPSCGMRLPDIGLCAKPGFDRCLNCGATQPQLLPDGNRPRPNCHKCGERLHNPELPAEFYYKS